MRNYVGAMPIVALVALSLVTGCQQPVGSDGGGGPAVETFSVIYHADDAEGGTVPGDDQAYATGEDVTVLGNPGGLSRSGYTFSGWSDQSEGAGTPYTKGTILTMGDAELHLYAVWTDNPTYRVYYDANEGDPTTVPVDETGYEEDQNFIVIRPDEDPVRDGYLFDVWNDKQDGTGKLYVGGFFYPMPAEDLTLYAQWEEVTYRVDYDGNGVSGSIPGDSTDYAEGDTVTVKRSAFAPGHLFHAWNSSEDGSGISYRPGDTFVMGTEDVSLYGLWGAVEALEAPDLRFSDEFAAALSTGGDFAIVGAPGTESPDAWVRDGAAYIFKRSAGTALSQVATLTPPSDNQHRAFGTSVAISNNYAVATALRYGDGPPAAYVFRRESDTNWQFLVKLALPETADWRLSNLGEVAITDEYAVVGAPAAEEGGVNIGAVYIYQVEPSADWAAPAKIPAPHPDTNRSFGQRVAMDGDSILVGAPRDVRNGAGAGAAYVLLRTGTNAWGSISRLATSPISANANFGDAVDISGDYAIVGARGHNEWQGSAFIYYRTGANSWDDGVEMTTEWGDPMHYQRNEFATAVAINGEFAVAGSNQIKKQSLTQGGVGGAVVYRRTGRNAWDAGDRISRRYDESAGELGNTIAILDDVLLIGDKRGEGVAQRSGTVEFVELR